MIDLSKLTSLINLNEAVERLVKALSKTIQLEVEEAGLVNSVNRVLAVDIYAENNRPEFDIAAVDGYAVRSIDTTGATQYNPVELSIVGVVKPGQKPSETCLEPGTAVRIHTGTPIPYCADAVVMDEDVDVSEKHVVVFKPVPHGSNIIRQGEDFAKGELLVRRGSLIKPSMIAALAALGISKVKVFRKINASVLAIGDELVEPGEERVDGKIYNSTAYIVLSLLQQDRIFEVKYSGIIPDDAREVEEAIAREISNGADLVITTGGTGISESDVVSHLVKKGDSVVFRGVRMRPGRPTSSFIYRNKLVVNFSGFPVAAWAGYEVLLRRAFIKWLSIRELERHVVNAVLTRRIPNTVGYSSVIRVMIRYENGVYYADPYMLRGSGVISSLLRTNGYVIIPEDIEGYEKNTLIQVYLYD
ncbi:MAG: molybdopterin molybdotransferase MoeA [Desulfurococcaceae archaeon]